MALAVASDDSDALAATSQPVQTMAVRWWARCAPGRVQLLAFEPQVGVGQHGALAQEGQVALVDLRQHRVAGAGKVGVGRQAVVAAQRADDVGVGLVLEHAGAARHAQVLQPVLGMDDQRRRRERREARLQPHDAAVEDGGAADADDEVLAEVEHAAVEPQEAGAAARVAPVAEFGLAVRQAGLVLAADEAQQARVQPRLGRAGDREAGPGGGEGAAGVVHDGCGQ